MINRHAERRLDEELPPIAETSEAESAGRDMPSPSEKPPFFILGSQRSGTTMLRLMLNNHCHLCVPHETGFITQFHNVQREYGDLSIEANARKLAADISEHSFVKKGGLIPSLDDVTDRQITDYTSLIEAIFSAYAERSGKKRWGDKTPSYTEDIDIIRQLFPSCKIIHLVRDGRDVLVSQKNIKWTSRNTVKLIRDWQWKVTIAHKVGAVLGSDFLEVKYEDLVRESETTLREICRFLDEDYDPDMMSYTETAKDVVPAESIQWHQSSVKRPSSRKIGAWKEKLSSSELIMFDDIAGETLELFGYERTPMKHNLRSLLTLAYFDVIRRY